MNYRKKIKNVSRKDCRESGGLFVMREYGKKRFDKGCEMKDSHLDKSMKKKLYDYIVNSNQTIIFISHDEEFGELADQVICL